MSFNPNVVQLAIPYEKKDEAKKYKCFFTPDDKLWACTISDDDDDDKKEFTDNYQQVYLNVPYDEKDTAKSKGAKFDFKTKTWYTYKGNQELKHYM